MNTNTQKKWLKRVARQRIRKGKAEKSALLEMILIPFLFINWVCITLNFKKIIKLQNSIYGINFIYMNFIKFNIIY